MLGPRCKQRQIEFGPLVGGRTSWFGRDDSRSSVCEFGALLPEGPISGYQREDQTNAQAVETTRGGEAATLCVEGQTE